MKMKKADVAVAIYIMAAIIMFIVPIPSWLLDILLAINISVALTILFATMFSKEVLDMSFFPTMLLFTTIFRIALNTSSTRLILRDGNAGNVVETFGEFVGGGDLVIGVIIFIILILIQFMVINKGSERVSEVTARFTLDAMPGKQMAIDADLNTGAITDAEAKKRREKIQEEASFFGSMDGAVKYVKGDEVAGQVTGCCCFETDSGSFEECIRAGSPPDHRVEGLFGRSTGHSGLTDIVFCINRHTQAVGSESLLCIEVTECTDDINFSQVLF